MAALLWARLLLLLLLATVVTLHVWTAWRTTEDRDR